MNAENFHEYLRNPSMLYQISYQELKSLVLQYPYSPNLRYLLMAKSMVDSNKEYDKNLTLAALYSIDRKKLFKQVKLHDQLRSIQDNYALNEDFLELKDLSTLEEIIESPPAAGQKAPIQQAAERDDILNIESLTSLDSKDSKGFFGDDEDDIDLLEDLLEEDDFETGGPASQSFNQNKTEEQGERQPDQETQEPGTHPESLEDMLEDLPSENVIEEGPAAIVQEAGGQTDLHSLVEFSEPDFSEQAENAAILSGVLENLEFGVPESKVTLTENSETDSSQNKEIIFEITNESGEPAESIEPAPKTSFNSWLRQRQPPQVGLLSIGLKEIAHTPKENEKSVSDHEVEDRAKDYAAKSIQENEWIASETLAALLEAQGHYEKAIAMYERLSLQNPQKSSFFARKIEKLKRK